MIDRTKLAALEGVAESDLEGAAEAPAPAPAPPPPKPTTPKPAEEVAYFITLPNQPTWKVMGGECAVLRNVVQRRVGL